MYSWFVVCSLCGGVRFAVEFCGFVPLFTPLCDSDQS
ncbi:unnamed protein product [Brassica rapa subsp. narinosa]|uniref:Uncharacterized protein n=2 Tax=Brassica TaxID=3705 RepID=A0A3P6CUK0_BRACM|nr:unnamed protein product [Brassica napus]VDD12082.1 unnamed protein product [Brassica rapa]